MKRSQYEVAMREAQEEYDAWLRLPSNERHRARTTHLGHQPKTRRARIVRDRTEANRLQRAARSALWDARRMQGLCYRCGHAPHLPGTGLCVMCQKRRADQRRKKNPRKQEIPVYAV